MVESQKKIKEIKFNDISHPLDPLTSEEINLVTSIVKNKSNLGKFLLFETITLIEPPKNQVLSFSLGDEIMRKAFVVALNYKEEKLYELEIDISNEKYLDVIINLVFSQHLYLVIWKWISMSGNQK